MGSIDFISKLLSIPAILIGFTVHEYAHALIADRLGDKTPKFQGRLTLNPLVHIDPFGFLAILIFGFGWAKPVQTNPSAFRHGYKDDLKVSLAGVVANILTAFIFAFITAIVYALFFNRSLSTQAASFGRYIENALYLVIYINVMLSIFNLLPIPGLDGFHILRDIFPKFFYKNAEILNRYQYVILIVLLLPIFGGSQSILDFILVGPVNSITSAFLKLALLVVP